MACNKVTCSADMEPDFPGLSRGDIIVVRNDALDKHTVFSGDKLMVVQEAGMSDQGKLRLVDFEFGQLMDIPDNLECTMLPRGCKVTLEAGGLD